MFGYITVNRSELKVRELNRYQSWYCGLCCALRDTGGLEGRLTLTYDMTFLAILLSSLYDRPLTRKKILCAVHPLSRHDTIRTVFSAYAADMNILLSYYDMLDDWRDDRNFTRLMQARALRRRVRDISKLYSRQSRAVRDYIAGLTECEREDDGNVERAAALTGKMLGEIFVMQEDEWSSELRTMGFFLGKFIYLADAYEDLEKDEKIKAYNPLKNISGRGNFDDSCRDMLTMQMSECCRAFERLPVVRDAGILRNILYSGVWTGFAKTYRYRKNIVP